MTAALMPDAVLALRYILDAALSPDGRLLAYAVQITEGGCDRTQIVLHDVASGEDTPLTSFGTAAHPRWKPQGSVLAFVDNCPDGARLCLLAVDQLTASREAVIPLGATSCSAPAWSPDGRQIAIVATNRDPAPPPAVRRVTSREYRAEGWGDLAAVRQTILLVDASQSVASPITPEHAFYSNLEWTGDGKAILFLKATVPIPFAGASPRLCRTRIDVPCCEELLDDYWSISKFRIIPDTPKIALIGAHRSKLPVPVTDLWTFDLVSGEHDLRSAGASGRVGYRMHHDMPIWGLANMHGLTVRDPEYAYATIQTGGTANIYRISLQGRQSCEPVSRNNRSDIAIGFDAARKRLLFASTDMLLPVDLYILDASGKEMRATCVNRDTLRGWPGLQRRRVKVTAPDGLDLDAWILSQNLAAGARPTILYIHGGPFNAIGEAFRFDLHMLASHGFNVVFGNFRGSFGYGEKFAQAVVGDWGGRGYIDHIAIINHAIDEGVADANHLGVWGASYGGYATCWIVGHTNIFKAAVAEAAVTNLETAYHLSDARETRQRDLGGRPHEIPDVYRSRSPLAYAHRCTTPTLLIHGEKDIRCPIVEAEQFFSALLDVGCPTELLRLRDADHLGDSIGPPETRVAQNEALLDWFERFI